MAKIVYILCALTSLGCAVLLMKSYVRSRARLLFWSAACFTCFAASNVILFFDLAVLGPQVDLSLWRQSVSLAGLAMLLYGLIWETK